MTCSEINAKPPSRQARNQAAIAPREDAATHSVYGLAIGSDFDFTYPLPSTDGQPDLRFSCTSEAADPDFWRRASCVYATQTRRGEQGGLFRDGACEALRLLGGVADFHLRPNHVRCYLRDQSYKYAVEIWWLGTVLAYWMEQHGFPMLHASAVVVEGRAAAFLATSKGGKSSLAATLMQAGHPLLTDDLLPIEIQGETLVGRPGYPQMRLWPDQAAHFAGPHAEFERVVPHLEKRRVPVEPRGLGAFCKAPRPLARLYLPERRAPEDPNDEIEITPLPLNEALIELVRQSFLPRLIEAAGLQPVRMERLAQTVRRVPTKRIAYPSGVEHLPRVRDAILRDLRAD